MSISEIFKNIRTVTFRYKTKVSRDNRKNFGVIAQEVAEVFDPKDYSVVNMEEDGYFSVRLIQFVPLLIEYCKELEKRIELLEKNHK